MQKNHFLLLKKKIPKVPSSALATTSRRLTHLAAWGCRRGQSRGLCRQRCRGTRCRTPCRGPSARRSWASWRRRRRCRWTGASRPTWRRWRGGSCRGTKFNSFLTEIQIIFNQSCQVWPFRGPPPKKTEQIGSLFFQLVGFDIFENLMLASLFLRIW